MKMRIVHHLKKKKLFITSPSNGTYKMNGEMKNKSNLEFYQKPFIDKPYCDFM